MRIERYSPEAHDEELKAWARAHNGEWANTPSSPNGWVVPGVAAGWLYLTDGDWGVIEDVISNPEANSYSRNLAFGFLHDEALAEAKKAGKKRLLGLLNSDGMGAQAKQHGFRLIGVTLVVSKDI